MYRQIGKTSSNAGSTASVVPALSSVHVTSGFVDTDASVTGRVRVCGEPSTSIENRNSLYESMNANSPVPTRLGSASGRTIRRRIFGRVAPSSCADSSISAGRVAEYNPPGRHRKGRLRGGGVL